MAFTAMPSDSPATASEANPSGGTTEQIQDSLPDADLKIILLGDSAVGKSKMIERYLMEEYNPRQLSTYALTLFRKDITMAGQKYSIDFWDTAGQEQFDKLHSSYYYGANACILVQSAFDVTRKITYKNLEKWYKELRENQPNIPVVCVANKMDADKTVVQKTFKFPQKNDIPFFFVSAADGTNVVRVFNEAVKLAVKAKEEPEDVVMAEIMRLLQEDDNAGSKSLENALDTTGGTVPSQP